MDCTMHRPTRSSYWLRRRKRGSDTKVRKHAIFTHTVFSGHSTFGVSTHPKLSQLWVTTNISLDDGIASRDLAFEVADYFKLSAKRARSIVGQVGNAVVRWDTEASALGIGKNDREGMASAFEHADLRKRQQNPVERPPTTEMNSTPLHRLADLPLQTAGT
jgi:hypothetical protein